MQLDGFSVIVSVIKDITVLFSMKEMGFCFLIMSCFIQYLRLCKNFLSVSLTVPRPLIIYRDLSLIG